MDFRAPRKVRDGEDALASTRDACATHNSADHARPLIDAFGRTPKAARNGRHHHELSRNGVMNLFENFAHAVTKFPVRIMRLELSHIANPPDVVADAVAFFIGPV
jgi:hypothetical protein